MSTEYVQSIFKAQIDKETVDSTREITFVIASEGTTHKEHRNRFQYNWSNWKLDNYNANPIVGYQHNVWGDNMCVPPNPDDVVAKSFAWVDNFNGKKSLMAKATFEPKEVNPTAEKIFQKVKLGTLNATSVGILPIGLSKEVIRNEKNEVVDSYYNMQGQELAEWSIVHIPADPRALRQSLKSHTIAAISFVQRLLEDSSINDIKKMSVQEVLDAIDKKYVSQPLEKIEEELSGPDPNLNKYLNRLNQFKNGQVKK